MDSSSDGSFAWTDASDDTTDNETMASTHLKTSQSGEESESGKAYKKKLQQQLFSDSTNDKTNKTESHQHKKRKLSQHYSDGENIETSKKKRIKTEPVSDFDKRKIKKIHTSSETNGQDDDPYDESFLNLKVESEQNFLVPSPVRIKKSKSKRLSCVDHTSMSNGDGSELHQSPIENKLTSRSQILYEDDSSHVEEGENLQDIDKPKKKKKSKRKREYSECEDNEKDSIIRDSFSAEETVVEKRIETQNDDSTDALTNSTGDVQDYKLRSKNKSSKVDVEKLSNNNVTQKNMVSQINPQNISDIKKTDHKPRMSERITFEDEEDSDVQTKSAKATTKTKKRKSKLESYLESSIHLRPFSTKLPSALVLTDDDDVWVVRCPNEINAEAFQDKRWTLDSKCKIKLDGKAYEGDVDNHKSNMTILSSKNGKEIIKNLTVNGCIRLRRRIPKTHIQEDNIMTNNQNNFIPLPETKWRHPLFGLHYKKAMKLPSQVTERLQDLHIEATVSSGKRKKKRDRKKLEENEHETTTPKPEHYAETFDTPDDLILSNTSSKKKKKKHKLSKTAADEVSTPRQPPQKRVKHNPESAEAWESEKAIEENLFNF